MTTRVDAATSWRIVCPNYGQTGHSTHSQTSPTLERATSRAAANDRLYEHLAKGEDGGLYPYYRSEIGWRVETRTVTEWEDIG